MTGDTEDNGQEWGDTPKMERQDKGMKEKTFLPFKLQFFADDGTTSGDAVQGGATQVQQPTTTQSPDIDYTKIQRMLDGTLAAKEDTVLKAYFKQQGLSHEEMDQAITGFKQQKASQQPDIGALTQQAQMAQETAKRAQVESAATIAAVSLGLNVKTIPYAIKMADLSQAIQDGKVNEEAVASALKQILEDVPALKPQTEHATGFMQVGASGTGQQHATTDEALKKAFGL